MKLSLTSIALFLFFFSGLFAQHDFKKNSVGPGTVITFTIGELSKSAQVGYGASVQLVYRFGKSYEAFEEPTFAIFSSSTPFENSFNMFTGLGEGLLHITR